jgi:hypothetical protein
VDGGWLRWAFCCTGVGRGIVLLAVAALAETFDFPVFEGQEEVVVDGVQGCQGLEAADGLFWQFGSESGNRMERVIWRRGGRAPT